jgi:hypothetical protein
MFEDLAKAASVAGDISIVGLLIFVIAGAFTKKWVPGVYYVELQRYIEELKAHIARLETNLGLMRDAVIRSAKVAEDALEMVRDLQTLILERGKR